jgi:hypothetical protein
MDAVTAAEALSMRTRRARLQDAYAIYRLVHGHSNDGTLLHRCTADKAVQDNAMKHNEVKNDTTSLACRVCLGYPTA